jgi:hypothetical protein
VTEARAARDQAASAADRAVQEASTGVPPVEIAFAVERVTTSVLSQPMLGRGPSPQADALAQELERIADRVAAIWVPGFDGTRVAEALHDERTRADAAARLAGPPRGDAHLGWAPIEPAELVVRAAASLAGPDFRDASARLQREAAEHAGAIRGVAAARERIGLGDRLTFGRSDNQQHLALAEQALTKEWQELLAANEAVHLAVQRALGAYPPMGIATAALAAAGILGADLEGSEQTIVGDSGEVFPQPSACLRAVLLAALVELRRATDASFPGVCALVSGRGGARDARDLARAAEGSAAPGPYRAPSPNDDEPPPAPPRAEGADAWLSAALERTDVRAGIGRALAHGVMLGTLLRGQRTAPAPLGSSAARAFWAAAPMQVSVDDLAARTHWHRAVAFGVADAALATVGRTASTLGIVRLRDRIVQAQVAIKAIRLVSQLPGATGQLHGLPDALAAVDALGAELASTWGARGEKSAFAYDVVRHLSTSPPVPPPAHPGEPLRPLSYREIVITAGEALRGSDFVAIEARLRRAGDEARHADVALQASAAGVTSWDTLNFVARSSAEEQVEAWNERLRALAGSMAADLAAAEHLLDSALAAYPPAALYFELGAVHVRASRIAAVLRAHSSGEVMAYTMEVVGKGPALDALAAWTRKALWVFGAMPSNGEILERLVARELS